MGSGTAVFVLAPEPPPAVWPKWCAPLIVLRNTNRPADRIVGEHVGRALIRAPHDIICSIDDTIFVVVAGHAGHEYKIRWGIEPLAVDKSRVDGRTCRGVVLAYSVVAKVGHEEMVMTVQT